MGRGEKREDKRKTSAKKGRVGENVVTRKLLPPRTVFGERFGLADFHNPLGGCQFQFLSVDNVILILHDKEYT